MKSYVRGLSQTHWAMQAAAWAVLGAAYVAVAQLSFHSASIHPVVASVWPPAGMALAMLLIFGFRLWPGIFIGALLANALNGIQWPAATTIAVGNTLAAISGAYVLGRLGFQSGLHRIRDALMLLGFGALLAPVCAATMGTLSLHWGAGVPAEQVARIWLTWWSGDALGVMLITPLLLAWTDRQLPGLTRHRLQRWPCWRSACWARASC